ncbi:phage tail tape measure protein [Bacillus suaedae]|uniref:Replication protein n=1 Tax=Halalkalibacter suaedae TaxID=2822140 RepID=A0A940WR15_9BACI|nr:phage tail tape measure protein [Bacillus suaedae]MBP3951124.1 replication protein [Bacillus suaedae]
MAKNPETKVKFTVFNKEFNDGIREMNAESTKLRKEFRLQEEQLKQNGSQTERFDAKLANLSKQHEVAKNKVQSVQGQLSKAKEVYGENSVEVGKLEDKLLTFQIAEQKVENQIANTTKQQNTYQQSLKNLQGLFTTTGTDVKDFTDTLGSDLVKAINNGTASSKDLNEAFNKVSKEALGSSADINKVRQSINKIDDGSSIKEVRKDLNKLSKDADEATKSVDGLGNEIGAIVGGLGVAGLSSQALDATSLKAKIDISYDVPESAKGTIRDAIKDIEAYGVDAESALEGVRRQWALNKDASNASNSEVVKGASAIVTAYGDVDFTELIQETNEISNALGISNQEALGMTNSLLKTGFPPEQLDIIAEYGTQLQMAGYSAKEIQGLFAAGVDTGTWNIDNLMDGLKEGRIRVAELGYTVPDAISDIIDGTKLSADQFTEWGKAVAKGGEGGSQAMKEIAIALQNMDDETKKNALGVQIFGTMWEDQGVNIIDTILNADNAIVNLKQGQDNLNNSVSRLDETPAVQMKQAINELKVASEPLILIFAGVISRVAQWTKNNPTLVTSILAIITVIGTITGVCLVLAPILTSLIGLSGALGISIGAVASPILIVIGVITALIAIGIALYKNWDTVTSRGDAFIKKLGPFKGVLLGLISPITSVIGVGVSLYKNWDTIMDKASILRSKISNLFKGLNWSLPKIKLPHFSIKGKFDLIPPNISMPKVNVSWHKTGGVMTKPFVAGNAGFGDVEEGIVPFEGSHAMKIAKLIAQAQNHLSDGLLNRQKVSNDVNILIEASDVIMEGRSVGKILWKPIKEFIDRDKGR